MSRLKENPLGDWPQSFNAKNEMHFFVNYVDDAVPKKLRIFSLKTLTLEIHSSTHFCTYEIY